MKKKSKKRISKWYNQKGKSMIKDFTKYYPQTKKHVDFVDHTYNYFRSFKRKKGY